ncbi:hypothetical protein ABIA22_002280 [Sinorhizobium fredii]|uniref:hypothetical protein n=1 Tax=Rhizobium fredii TaxID=380 RepID=UPI003514319B
MADRPILFSGPMVRALLAGTKTQTRRTLKERPPEWATYCQQPTMLNVLQQWVPSGLWAWSEDEQNPPRPLRRWPVSADGEHYWLRPRFSIGDRMWVRESWKATGLTAFNKPSETRICGRFAYKADPEQLPRDAMIPWRPSIHMPRWASRMTLIVTDVRVERLQDISEADAIAEGAELSKHPAMDGGVMVLTDIPGVTVSPGVWYRWLWDEINGKGAWKANPWVAAYTFRVIKQNIDQIEKVAA